MRGVVTTRGHSPFYEYCMKHFLKIDYMNADYLSMKNKQFIEDLMPNHPIYINLLPKTLVMFLVKSTKIQNLRWNVEETELQVQRRNRYF